MGSGRPKGDDGTTSAPEAEQAAGGRTIELAGNLLLHIENNPSARTASHQVFLPPGRLSIKSKDSRRSHPPFSNQIRLSWPRLIPCQAHKPKV